MTEQETKRITGKGFRVNTMILFTTNRLLVLSDKARDAGDIPESRKCLEDIIKLTALMVESKGPGTGKPVGRLPKEPDAPKPSANKVARDLLLKRQKEHDESPNPTMPVSLPGGLNGY